MERERNKIRGAAKGRKERKRRRAKNNGERREIHLKKKLIHILISDISINLASTFANRWLETDYPTLRSQTIINSDRVASLGEHPNIDAALACALKNEAPTPEIHLNYK